MIIIIATFGQAVAGQAKAINILGIIVVWRFIVSASAIKRSSEGPTSPTDGYRHRWRLPSFRRYLFRIRVETESWTSYDCSLRQPGMGTARYVFPAYIGFGQPI